MPAVAPSNTKPRKVPSWSIALASMPSSYSSVSQLTSTSVDAGKTVKDTVKTYVYKERFGKEDVEITKRKITHITPDIKRTVEEEESKYHYAEKHEEWHGNEGISGSSKRSKVKQCKMPAGFSAKYLSTTKAIATLNLSDDN